MDRQDYHRQIAAARDVGLAMTREQLAEFVKILEEYARELALRVSIGLATRNQAYALAVAREIIGQLTRDLATATRDGIVTTADRVARIHAQATAALMESAGIGTGVLFSGLSGRAAQAVLSRPELAASFKSIRRESVAAVDRILKRSLVRGIDVGQLDRELRLHVLGSDALPDHLLLDRRRIGYAAIRAMGYEATPANLAAVRKDAGTVAMKARLIARTEVMVAEHEAHVQAAIDSPVVGIVRWNLSYRHAVKDACDLLASVDWYGYGPGGYDPRRVPARPHPRCTCPLRNELRPVSEWGKARGGIPRRRHNVEEIGETYQLYPSQIAALAAVLDIAEGRGKRAA